MTDDAEWPVLAPGQVVFVERLRPRGANYFEQVFALRYRGTLLVRHLQLIGRTCRLWGIHDGYRFEEAGSVEVRCHPQNRDDDWHTSGWVHPDVQLIGPVIYPYGHPVGLKRDRGIGRETPAIFFAWSN